MGQKETGIFEQMGFQSEYFLDRVRALIIEDSPETTREFLNRFLEAVSMGNIFIYPHSRAIVPRSFKNSSGKVVLLIPDDFAEHADSITDEKFLQLIEKSIKLF